MCPFVQTNTLKVRIHFFVHFYYCHIKYKSLSNNLVRSLTSKFVECLLSRPTYLVNSSFDVLAFSRDSHLWKISMILINMILQQNGPKIEPILFCHWLVGWGNIWNIIILFCFMFNLLWLHRSASWRAVLPCRSFALASTLYLVEVDNFARQIFFELSICYQTVVLRSNTFSCLIYCKIVII